MQALEILDKLQADISIDFVIELLPLQDLATQVLYNAILVIIDRFTKYAEIILFRNNYTAEQLGYIILDKLVRYYRILKLIISNRDKLFTLNYQIILLALISTKQKLSTAYYLQIDRQTEQTNYIIK